MCCHCFCQSQGKLHATVVCSIILATDSAHGTLHTNRHKTLHEIMGCTAAVLCAEGWSSYKAINLHHSWIECEWGFQQGGSVLPSWQLEYLKPAEVEARKNMQVRDRLSCRIGGSEAMSSWRMAIYSPLSPACPRLHTPTLYRHFLNTVCRAKVGGDGRKSMTWLSLMHLFCVFPLAFLSSSD